MSRGRLFWLVTLPKLGLVGSVEADTGSFHAEALTLGVSYVLNRAIQH